MKNITNVLVFLLATVCVFVLIKSDAISKPDSSSAADFTLEDQNGNTVSLSDYNNNIVVLEWINPDCPFVQRHYKEKTMVELSEKYKDKDVVWLAVNSTHYMDKEDNKKWADTYNVSYPILDDHEGVVGNAYGAKTTPHMFILNTSDNFVYEGAIDDDPRGSNSPEKRVNYVDKSLVNLQAGEAVEIAKTKPYGCSVKYSK